MNKYADARIGILGATGYTGRELIGLLAAHPHARIAWATSQSEASGCLRPAGAGSVAISLLRAEEAPVGECDVVISCLPHGESASWMERVRRRGVGAIDLSADLRVPGALKAPRGRMEAVYGLPELHRDRVRGAALVANPRVLSHRCPCSPLRRRCGGGWVSGPVIINAASGVTGAGRSPKRELLFAEVAEDFRAYAVGNVHRHLAEMQAQTTELAGGAMHRSCCSLPTSSPSAAGILETIHLQLAEPIESPAAAWVEDYADEPFVEVMQERGALTRGRGGNEPRGDRDLSRAEHPHPDAHPHRGDRQSPERCAAGQAVQNLNLMLGWPETAGLL